MPSRANAIYRDLSPRIEICSIDESFLDLSDVAERQRSGLASESRATVSAWTGLPTCVGIGPTKTIARTSTPARLEASRTLAFDLAFGESLPSAAARSAVANVRNPN